MGWTKTVDKREVILNAAEACLREQGLSRVSVRDIAKEAEVSLGSVHYYFASKEHILMEIFRTFVARVSKATFAGLPQADPRQMILGFVDGLFGELAKDPDACRFLIGLWEHISYHDELQEILTAYYRASHTWMTSLIEKGNKTGIFDVDDPAGTATQIIALTDGLKVQVHILGADIDLERMRLACRDLVEKALGGPPQGGGKKER